MSKTNQKEGSKMGKDKSKDVGLKPGAHPTAPGGMSQKALLHELVIKHAYTVEEAAEFKPLDQWGRLVEQVVVERQQREVEAKEKAERKAAKKAKKGKGKKAKGKKAKADTPTPDPEAYIPTEGDDLTEAEALLAEVEADLAADEPTTEEKGKRAATKAEQALENIAEVLAEDEGTETEVQYAPVKEYQRKPIASSIAKFPHIHIKGKCFQNNEGAPCEAEPMAAALTTAPVEATPISEDDIVAMWEEMDNEHAVAVAEYEEAHPPLFIPIRGVQDFVFDGHMGAGPSGAERWMNCTGSLGLTRKFLETLTRNQQEQFAEAGVAAREGTVAHEAAEVQLLLMLGRIKPKEAEKRLIALATEHPEDEAYSEEMGEWITQYTDLVKQYVDAGHEVLVEARLESVVPMPTPLPDGAEHYIVVGSGDFVALPTEAEPSTLTVGDLKYGDALWVDVDSNPQVRIYALGALVHVMDDEGNLPEDLTTIDYHIIQPRLGGIKSWTEPVEDLLTWRDEVLSPALSEALRPDAPLTPGDQQCQWCPVRGNCPALTALRVEQAQEMFTDINEHEVSGNGLEAETDTLTDDKIGRLLSQVNGLVSLQKALKAEVERRLHRGHVIPGFDLRNYSPPRGWTEDAQDKIAAGKGRAKNLTSTQRDSLFKEPSLLTPKQAIDVLNAQGVVADEVLAKFIVTPEKRPVVSTGPNDRRSLWAGKPPEQMFPDLTDEEMQA